MYHSNFKAINNPKAKSKNEIREMWLGSNTKILPNTNPIIE